MSDSVDARMVEAAARALCIENGDDPDEWEQDMGEDAPSWTLFALQAEAVVAALQPFLDAEQAEMVSVPRGLFDRLLVAYADEEREHGFPFNFALRDAHRELRALVAGVRRDA